MGTSAEDKKELSNYVSFSPKLIFILMVVGIIGGTLYILTYHGIIFSSKPSLINGGAVEIIFMLMDIAASTGLLYILKAALSAYGKPMNRLLWWLISFIPCSKALLADSPPTMMAAFLYMLPYSNRLAELLIVATLLEIAEKIYLR